MISVLVPSRGRPESLARSVFGLLDLAADPLGVEVLAALDPDDAGAYGTTTFPPQVSFWVAPERYGYHGLHLYWNHLATLARGDWLMTWNDDARMVTPGWDAVVRAQAPAVLWLKANHNPCACMFPVWPAAWTRAMGHVSLSPHIDTWLQWLAQDLGVLRKIPVEVLHDRADVTGNHDDQTYAEGRKRLGSEGMVPGFNAASVRAQIEADVRIIRGLPPRGWAGAR